MKGLILIATIVLLSFSPLQKDENPDSSRASLYGKWKYSEVYSDPGDGSGQWRKVPDSVKRYLDFLKNGKIGGSYFNVGATFKIKSKETIIITFANKWVQQYNYTINNKTLQISPSVPLVCKEGCADRFTKIDQ